ncbi:hypothetical protein GCM10010517_59410 [Streptosporangium fragile]|uniref:Uncharacterized protein n=1 Tax=Streptosporangium fragile TaxID=46186 RepID=A0ABN3W600_9ACTN
MTASTASEILSPYASTTVIGDASARPRDARPCQAIIFLSPGPARDKALQSSTKIRSIGSRLTVAFLTQPLLRWVFRVGESEPVGASGAVFVRVADDMGASRGRARSDAARRPTDELRSGS